MFINFIDIGLAVLYVILVAIFFEGLKAFRFYISRKEAYYGIDSNEW